MTMSDAAEPTAAQRRKFGLLLLVIALVLTAIVVGFTLVTGRLWMLFGLLLVIPNIVKGISELRASRRQPL